MHAFAVLLVMATLCDAAPLKPSAEQPTVTATASTWYDKALEAFKTSRRVAEELAARRLLRIDENGVIRDGANNSVGIWGVDDSGIVREKGRR